MEVKGYKAFNKDKTNRYGRPFEEGKSYHIDGEISFGNNGNGFHMCTELVDVFRYFPKDDVIVAQVRGFGNIVRYDDEYYGYYDMYVVSDIIIERFISREEIIDKVLGGTELNVRKFIVTFEMTEKEKYMFLKKYRKNVDTLRFLMFYQFGIEDFFNKSIIEQEETLKKVLINGQDNNKRS